MNTTTMNTTTKNTLGDTPDEVLDAGVLGKVTVPGEWIDFLTRYNDMFRSDHSGYWMFGAVHFDGGWIAYECADDKRPTEEEIGMVENAHDEGQPLPERWFVIDKAFAIKAYLERAKEHGVDWYNNLDHDASDYDVAVQMAALGEVRYG